MVKEDIYITVLTIDRKIFFYRHIKADCVWPRNLRGLLTMVHFRIVPVSA